MSERTPSDDAWLALKKRIHDPPPSPRYRRGTGETGKLSTFPAQWRQLPLTLGLLLALIAGVVFVAHVVRSYSADMRSQIDRAIEQHNRDAIAHQHMAADQRAKNAEIYKRLSEMQSQIDRLKERRRIARRR